MIGLASLGACGRDASKDVGRHAKGEGGAGGAPQTEGGAAGLAGADEVAGEGGSPNTELAEAGAPSGGAPAADESVAGAGAGGDFEGLAGAGGEPSAPPVSAYLYAGGTGKKIAGWAINPTSGTLTLLAGSPFPGKIATFAEHPSGRAIFAADYDGSTAAAFGIDAAGALTAIGSPLPAGNLTEIVKVHPSGKFLYAGNIYGGGSTIYDIDPQTFALSATSSVNFGNYHHGLAFDPTGKYFYLARNNNNDVTRFIVDQQTGAASDPRTIAAAGGYHAAMDPLGKYLVVCDWDKSGANKVSSYSLSPVDGTLTKVGDYVTGGSNPSGIVVTPDGRFVYLVNHNSSVAGFALDRATGELSSVPGSPFPGGSWELCVDHSGRFLYVGTPKGLAGYSIDHTTGALVALPGSPFDGGLDPVDHSIGACVLTRKQD